MSVYDDGGRPFKITDEIIERICHAVGIGTPLSASAAHGGITYRTFLNYYNAGEEVAGKVLEGGVKESELNEFDALRFKFFLKVEEAKANAAINWTNTINKAATNDPNWASYMLSKWYPELHGSKSRLELTGKDGEAIKTESVGELTPEEKLAAVKALAEAVKKRQQGND